MQILPKNTPKTRPINAKIECGLRKSARENRTDSQTNKKMKESDSILTLTAAEVKITNDDA